MAQSICVETLLNSNESYAQKIICAKTSKMVKMFFMKNMNAYNSDYKDH